MIPVLPTNHSCLDEALRCSLRGWSVLPVHSIDKNGHCSCGKANCGSPGKHPRTKNGLHDATMDIDQINEWWRKWPHSNLGIVTGKSSGLVVMDIDPNHGGFDSLHEMKKDYGDLPETVTVITGGLGEHLFFQYPSNDFDIRNATKLAGYEGIDVRANGGYVVGPGSNHLSGGFYDYEISSSPDDIAIAPMPNWLEKLCSNGHKQSQTNNPPGWVPELMTGVPEGQRNEKCTKLAGYYRRYLPQEVTRAILKSFGENCTPPMEQHEIDRCVASAYSYPIKTPTNGDGLPPANLLNDGINAESVPHKKTHINIYNSDNNDPASNRTIVGQETGHLASDADVESSPKMKAFAQQVESWIERTSGWWGVDEIDRDLGIRSPQQKDHRGKTLRRLEKRGIIERHPRFNKQFRYVNTQTVSLNFKTANNAGVLPIKWPLGIEKYVNLYPGNLVVIAGSPNAGKTAILLNFIHLNQDKFSFYYQCSEMGGDELRGRLDEFPGMEIDDWNFVAEERSCNFADVIRPDCVNVIDYMEMTTELYLVNDYLTAIQHKLGSGIAVVALQKDPDAPLGRGKGFGLEKPKLYLSMDRGKLKIIKGKNWAKKTVDPNGLQVSFKIINGCEFHRTSEWDWPQK